MFLAIVFIAIGVLLLLEAFGIVIGHFWTLLWAGIFLAIGIKMMKKHGGCPMCDWKAWKGKAMHMHGECCGEHNHKHEE